MSDNAVVNRTNIESLTARGAAFEASSYFTVPANGEYWYRVRIPATRVIATYNRLWISDLGGMKLEIFASPTGGTVGTLWVNANKNRRNSATSAVEIAPYSVNPTVGTGTVDDFVPAGSPGSKSTGAYTPQTSFRIYAPGDYAIKITNANNQTCTTKIVYEWVDVPTDLALY